MADQPATTKKVDTLHPEYESRVVVWKTIRDVLAGEEIIRENIQKYLPCPPGLLQQGSYDITTKQGLLTLAGINRYWFYASFAEFPETAAETLNGLQGMIHEKPPVIELPAELEYMIESCTPDGDTLQALWEHITEEVLSTGRIGILNEITPEDKVVLCPYINESIINYRVTPSQIGSPRKQPSLIVLREYVAVPKDTNEYASVEYELFRELYIEDNEFRVRIYLKRPQDQAPEEVVPQGVDNYVGYLAPRYFGDTFDTIPMTIINALNLGLKYGSIPIMPVVRRVLSIYRRSADYNRSLYNKGDPQVVLTGLTQGEEPKEVGGGSVWSFPNEKAKAQYLDIDGHGIPLMRQAILDQYDLMARETVRLVDDGKGVGPESGEAVRRRNASRQVTLRAVVMNAAKGLEAALKLAAKMQGVDDAKVAKIKFQPHTDFSEPTIPAEEVIKFTAARNLRAPLSLRSFHEILRRGRLTNLSFEEELANIASDESSVLGGPPNPLPPKVDNRLGGTSGVNATEAPATTKKK